MSNLTNQPNSQDRAAIATLLSEFCWLIDNGEASKVADLFTDTGKFITPVVTLSGKAELQAGYQAREQQTHITRHVWNNLRLTQTKADEITGSNILTLFRAEPDGPRPTTPNLVADNIDTYRRNENGTWLIAERIVKPSFFAALT